MTLSIALASPLASARSARADDSPPASLISRAFERARLEPRCRDRDWGLASLIPRLRLGATLLEGQLSNGRSFGVAGYALLAWPLGQTAAFDATAALRDSQKLDERRASLVEQIGAAWRRRQAAEEVQDALEAQLTVEEADAELEALTGFNGDGP